MASDVCVRRAAKAWIVSPNHSFDTIQQARRKLLSANEVFGDLRVAFVHRPIFTGEKITNARLPMATSPLYSIRLG